LIASQKETFAAIVPPQKSYIHANYIQDRRISTWEINMAKIFKVSFAGVEEPMTPIRREKP